MSLASFIPSELMNELILNKLNKTLVGVDVVSRNWEPLMANYGDSVKIPTLEDTAASDYTKDSTLTYSGISATSQILSIDQAKYYTYSVDMINSKQSAVNVANNVAYNASIALADAADQYILRDTFSGYANVLAGTGARALGAAGSAIAIYQDTTLGSGSLDYLGRLAQRLDENDVPQADRFVICPPWFHSILVKEKVLETATSNDDTYANGRVGRAMGFDIRVSTNLHSYNTSESNIFAGHRSCCEFAGYLVDTTIIPKMETKFAEGIRGLYAYGAKVVRTNSLAMGFITQTT